MRYIAPTSEAIKNFLSCTMRMENIFFTMETIIEHAFDIAAEVPVVSDWVNAQTSAVHSNVELVFEWKYNDVFSFLSDKDISIGDRDIFKQCFINLVIEFIEVFNRCGFYMQGVIPLTIVGVSDNNLILSDEGV